ncbi:hypothetical protein [Streptomyces sp.]|uniref:hypothetical protein n=1 Tax=Streptomyces sp. TaxID=1931 RepID=UPI002F3E4AEA
MLTVTLRRAFSAVLLAACLTTFVAACGADQTAGDGAPDGTTNGLPSSSVTRPRASTTTAESPTSTTSGAGPVETRVAYFSTSAHIPTGLRNEVLRSRAELQEVADTFAADDPEAAAQIVSGGGTTDFSRSVLVVWTETTGCSAADAALLAVSGNRLRAQFDQPKPPPECFAPFKVVVVFEVPKERMPTRPVLG